MMPGWLQAMIVFIYGSMLGRFACVIYYRLPAILARRPRRILSGLSYPPSACPKCGHPIRWFENIPVVSYLFLRGKCSACGAVIPLDHLLIEIASGTLAVAGWMGL